uniref:Efflux transporter, RND family, MFP subunit n=1 Tax=uncultured prokaryote TaxID=198431 RepID=H5SEL2_9ZZZZ|nr:efflux transporter, RND family, MFP subunit [uncultured prokaryote]
MKANFSKKIYLLLAGLIILISSCAQTKSVGKTQQVKKAVPVRVAKAEVKDLPLNIRAIGNVEAFSTVAIKSRVEGQLMRVYFKEGEDVKKGDLLFLIDPRPFEQAVAQAEGALARDLAQLENAELDLKRYEELLKEELVPKQQYDRARTNVESLKAIVKADRAQLENAKLQLQYCYIHSPIDGRIGSILVHPGNIIKPNETTMAVINQVKPVYISFSVPEYELLRIKKAMAKQRLRVEANIQGTDRKEVGELTFIDNAVNPSTGTIMMKATFPNRDMILWPGQFVDVLLQVEVRKNSVVIPSRAVQIGQQGHYVFVVKSDNTVELRPVSVLILENEALVEKGINPGDIVVTDGQLRLTPGSTIEVKEQME